jgi:hypothetical protein
MTATCRTGADAQPARKVAKKTATARAAAVFRISGLRCEDARRDRGRPVSSHLPCTSAPHAGLAMHSGLARVTAAMLGSDAKPSAGPVVCRAMMLP